jgi:hypothetical protein
MEFIKDILRALPNVASSPFAFVGYVIAIIAWTVIALRVQRNKNLLTNLKSLPSKDRLSALRDEMGTVSLKEGLSPEQYIKAKIHQYYFLAFAILCLTIIILFVVSSVKSQTPVSNTIRIFGKVFKSSDRRLGVANATVYLEQEVTRSVTTTENGEFLFEIPSENVYKQANVWAVADRFTSSAVISVVVQPLDKIFIPIEELTIPSTKKEESKDIKESETNHSKKPNIPPTRSPLSLNCFNAKLSLFPIRTEVKPGSLVRLSTHGVKGGSDFGNVSYLWVASAGRIMSNGTTAQLDTSDVPNCTIIDVQVTARNQNATCSAIGTAKILISSISQPCSH